MFDEMHDPEADEDVDVSDVETFDGDELVEVSISADGHIEKDGLLFCFSCGMLAQHGNEEYDWCDHNTGIGCSYFREEMDDFDSELDDDELVEDFEDGDGYRDEFGNFYPLEVDDDQEYDTTLYYGPDPDEDEDMPTAHQLEEAGFDIDDL